LARTQQAEMAVLAETRLASTKMAGMAETAGMAASVTTLEVGRAVPVATAARSSSTTQRSRTCVAAVAWANTGAGSVGTDGAPGLDGTPGLNTPGNTGANGFEGSLLIINGGVVTWDQEDNQLLHEDDGAILLEDEDGFGAILVE
jgi:hypothetical protein